MVQATLLLAFLCSVAYGQSTIRTRGYHGTVRDSFAVTVDSMIYFIEGEDPEGPPPDPRYPVFDSISYGTVTSSGFNATVTVHFEINQRVEIRIDIFDAVGTTVFVSTGRIFNKGLNYAKFDLKTKPNGTLYARLSTSSGEVRTVKLQQL